MLTAKHTKTLMVTASQAFLIFGNPHTYFNHLTLWDVPTYLEIGVIPKKLYCNRLMVEPLSNAFSDLIKYNLVNELKTFDGCYNVRPKRTNKSFSLHSWGIAIDFNAFENQLGKVPKMNSDVVNIFKAHGFDWGGDWSFPDGMHFQLAKI